MKHVTTDKPILKKLVFAKFLFIQGKLRFEHRTRLSANMALLNFHDAVEILLISINEKLGKDINKEKTFPVLVQDLKKQESFVSAGLTDLNKMRIEVKHYGNLVEMERIQDNSVLLENVFIENLLKFFNLKMSELKLSELVNNDDARIHLEEAETALEINDLEKFLSEIALAFSYIFQEKDFLNSYGIDQLADKILDFQSHDKRGQEDKQFRRYAEKPFENIEHKFENIREMLIVLSYGINLRDYFVFKSMTPYIGVSINGTRRLSFTNLTPYQHEWNFTKSKMEFLLNFVIDCSLKIEESSIQLISRHKAPHRNIIVESESALIFGDINNEQSIITTYHKGEELEESWPVALDFRNEWLGIKLKNRVQSGNVIYETGYVKRSDIKFI